ncbi:uncharacterized protein LOC110464868 [Mizuhopecten yessoensis]|uniref:Tachykinin n=1 Tax=Mizuhopecten yessoensis TaxID=6573 RepID=A0A210PSW7_MIZYE|nr:uncharacterized protein LOC110464868 [Mizuhopecten yessoensis]AXN93516.1 tachykinin [Mizuhopecten yessoensis]OWF39590.1 hypothetical protein KP79_PYT03973 [Mizuhopecten yessoensis]
MVNLDSITIVGLLVVAVFGVEAFTENSLWSQSDESPDTYGHMYDSEESVPQYRDNTRVTQLVESPEEAFRMIEAMKARTRRRMSPFSAMRGKKSVSESQEKHNMDKAIRGKRTIQDESDNGSYDLQKRAAYFKAMKSSLRGKRMVPAYSSPVSEFEYQLLLQKVLAAAMSLSGNRNGDEQSMMGKRNYGFHALRGR